MNSLQAMGALRFAASNAQSPAQKAAAKIQDHLKNNKIEGFTDINGGRDAIYITYEDGAPLWNNQKSINEPNPAKVKLTVQQAIDTLKKVPGMAARNQGDGYPLEYKHGKQTLRVMVSPPMRLSGF